MRLKAAAGLTVLFAIAIFYSALRVDADNAWGTYHWERSSNPVILPLGDNVDSRWDAYLAQSSADWSLSSVLDTIVEPGATSTRRCKPANGRIEICNDSYGFNGWLGVAGISVNGSHIRSSYVKLNDSYFDTPTYNTPAWRNLVMCQETGHAFGLDHQDENFNNANLGTCMDYTNDPESNQHPNQHDYDMLELIYGHLDEPDDGGGNDNPCRGRGCNRNLEDLDLSDPKEWGQAIRRSANGKTILFERDFGNGRKQFTFVYPVPGSDFDHGH